MNNFMMVLIHYVKEVVPALFVGFFISGIIHEFIPEKWVEKYLGRKGIFPIFWATLIGTFLPVCCCGSLPIALSFYKKGSNLGPVLAFLVATPATSISALIVSYRLLGGVFTLYMFFSVIVMGLAIGIMGNKFSYKPKELGAEICPHCEKNVSACKCEEGLWNKIKGIFKYAFIEMPKDIGVELIVGLLLAVIVESYIPLGKMIHLYLSSVWAYLFSVIFGLLMYFCSTASVPLINALMNQGMNPGAAFVLLLVGPITSYGTILVLRKEFGIKILVFYLTSVSFLAVILGFIYGRFIR